jgi:hypothetical protein
MEPQIIQYNRMIHNEGYRKAERYHNGIKYGEYYRLLKRAQNSLMKLYAALASLTGKVKGLRYWKSAGFTPESRNL